jgi:Flp pilus assembly protein TadG
MWNTQRLSVVLPLLNKRGIAAINGAFMAVAMAIMAGVAIDVGHALLTQAELQNAADAVALSAGTKMGGVYLAMPEADQGDMNRNLTSGEQAQINNMGDNTAAANSASNVASLALEAGGVEFGTWDFTAKTFAPSLSRPNAVQVTVSRAAGTQNGPIATFFAGMLGVSAMDVNATAIAALGTVGGPAGPGAVDAPFGISEDYFTASTGCGDLITFSPTGTQTGCAGWHVFDEQTGGGNKPKNCSSSPSGGGGGAGGANATLMRNVIECLDIGDYTSPPIVPGVTQFNFTGGQVSTAFSDLKDLFDHHKDSNGEWHIQVPVYQGGTNCANPTGWTTIVAYANVVVTQVIPPQGQGQSYIEANIECNTFFNAAPSPNPGGGGGPTSPISPIARLVS